jgi:DNA-binding IclR family transcriptional regulator
MKLQKKKNITFLSVLEKKFSSKIIFEIIKNNCEVVKSLQIDGVTNISVPIFDHTGQAIAAVTIPFLQRINKNFQNDLSLIKTTNLLRAQALKLSKSLGY